MNRFFRSASLVAALLVAGTAPMFADTTQFSQTVTNPTQTGGYKSVIDLNNSQNNYAIYDDFSLAGPATLDAVNWTGAVDPSSRLLGITISIYSNNAQDAPGTLLYQTTIAGDNNEDVFAHTFDNFNIAHYSAAINFDVTTTDTYWLSIEGLMLMGNRGDGAGTYGWTSADSSDGKLYSADAHGFHQASGDMAFSLLGNADVAMPPTVATTPEPSALVLTGTGLVGFAGMMRRRFVRR